MRAPYLAMSGQKQEPMIVQHAIYLRWRWERSERSETTSAPQTVWSTRTDAIEDADMATLLVDGSASSIRILFPLVPPVASALAQQRVCPLRP